MSVNMASESGPISFVECGCCGHYHKTDYWGDCRNDSERFTFEQIADRYGEKNLTFASKSFDGIEFELIGIKQGASH